MKKQYSLSYWMKQRFGCTSKPEIEFRSAIDCFRNNPSECEFNFDGSPIELANEMYREWKKRGTVHWCFFPTPLAVARDMAVLLGLDEKDTVFDAGAGFGNLLYAAKERGAKAAFGCEMQEWLPSVGATLGLNVQRGDFLDGYQPAPFTCVMTNPPFGRLGESSDATADFLNRLAEVCDEETRIAAILPHGYLQSERPKARVEAAAKFRVTHSEPLPADTFKPLTNCATDLVLMMRSGIKPRVNVVAPKPLYQPQARVALNAWSDL